MKEEWKDIKGYEGKYQVSNLGRVKSLDYQGKKREIILKPGINKGYYQVGLYKYAMCKSLYIHRLVAETFIENPNNLPCINHKDENKLNNRVDNLEFCTQKYNNRYSKIKKVGCYKDNKLIKIYDAIIDTEKDGFCSTGVHACCKGIHKSHKGFEWHYI